MIYLLVAVVVLGAVFAAFSANIQATTRWLGAKIAERKIIRTTPHALASPLEVQSMITPPWQGARILGGAVLYVGVFALGMLINWWVAVLSLISLVLVSGIVSAVFLPRRFSFWIKWISIGLQNRVADYRKNKDLERASSLSALLPILAEYEQLADSEALDITKIK